MNRSGPLPSIASLAGAALISFGACGGDGGAGPPAGGHGSGTGGAGGGAGGVSTSAAGGHGTGTGGRGGVSGGAGGVSTTAPQGCPTSEPVLGRPCAGSPSCAYESVDCPYVWTCPAGTWSRDIEKGDCSSHGCPPKMPPSDGAPCAAEGASCWYDVLTLCGWAVCVEATWHASDTDHFPKEAPKKGDACTYPPEWHCDVCWYYPAGCKPQKATCTPQGTFDVAALDCSP